MNARPRQLTCYVKKTRSDPDTWEAFCVELDVPAIGDTYEETVSMLYQAVENYINYVYERQPDDEQSLLYRPMSSGDAWKLMFEERVLQRLPFSRRQIRKTHLVAEKGIPPQLDPDATQLCFSCRKYRDVGLFEVVHSPHSSYVWHDSACNVCKRAGQA